MVDGLNSVHWQLRSIKLLCLRPVFGTDRKSCLVWLFFDNFILYPSWGCHFDVFFYGLGDCSDEVAASLVRFIKNLKYSYLYYKHNDLCFFIWIKKLCLKTDVIPSKWVVKELCSNAMWVILWKCKHILKEKLLTVACTTNVHLIPSKTSSLVD